MSSLNEILTFNKFFVDKKGYVPFEAGRCPTKKLTIVTCMDCRLVELLPKAMNIKNGDAIMVKSAGGSVDGPYGNVMKSILVSLYQLESEEVFIIGHTSCGMHGLTGAKMVEEMKKRGIPEEAISAIQEDCVDFNDWLAGFQTVEDQVQKSVDIVKNHPLLPQGTPVRGLVVDPKTGKLELVC